MLKIFFLICLLLSVTGKANATTITVNSGSKISDSVSYHGYDYHQFYKYAGSKYVACIKTTYGDADLYGHWTSAVSKIYPYYQFKSEQGGLSYDCISFEAGQSGWYYLAVYGYASSNYQIYVVGADMSIPWYLEDELECPLDVTYPYACGQYTYEEFGPFGSTWGNPTYDPFFTGSDDEFHVGFDYVADADDPVYAVADGYVQRSRNYGSPWGCYAAINHVINGYTITAIYGHINCQGRVGEGTYVDAGDQIGTIYEMTKPGELDHLHFSINTGTWYTTNGALSFDDFPGRFINAGQASLFQ